MVVIRGIHFTMGPQQSFFFFFLLGTSSHFRNKWMTSQRLNPCLTQSMVCKSEKQLWSIESPFETITSVLSTQGCFLVLELEFTKTRKKKYQEWYRLVWIHATYIKQYNTKPEFFNYTADLIKHLLHSLWSSVAYIFLIQSKSRVFVKDDTTLL